MVDQQHEIIKLLSQLVQKSSEVNYAVTSEAPALHSQGVSTTQASYTTLHSTPASSSFINLQEDILSTDDDYNFMNSPSWISLISDKSTGDPGSNSEPQSSTDLLQPLYDPPSYLPITSQPEVSHMAVTMQSVPAVTPQFLPVVTMQSTPRPSHPAATMHTVAMRSMSSAATMQPTPTNTFQPPQTHPSQQRQMLAGSTQTYMPPPPPFNTPPKLRTVEEVMRNYPGTDVHSLRRLATGMAREAIFGKKELQQSSLSGKNSTGSLDATKLEYIKNVVRSRVPSMSPVEYEYVWKMCRQSISKSCQTLRTGAKRKL